jgi:hypothetical protein
MNNLCASSVPYAELPVEARALLSIFAQAAAARYVAQPLKQSELTHRWSPCIGGFCKYLKNGNIDLHAVGVDLPGISLIAKGTFGTLRSPATT